MYCARHPEVDAVWECVRCERLHCEACVRRLGNGRHTVAACGHCDGVLRALQVEIAPPRTDLRGSTVRRVLSRQGLFTIAVAGGLGALAHIPMPLLDLAAGALYLAVGTGTYYNIVDHAARGRPGFPAPAELGGLSTEILTARGLLALLAFFVGFGVWFGATPGAETLDDLVRGHALLAAFLTALGTAWAFTGVLAMVNADSALAAFWPPTLLRVASYAPRAFALALGQAALLTALCALARRAVHAWLVSLPMLAGLVMGLLTAVLMFAQAALLGDHIRQNHLLYSVRK